MKLSTRLGGVAAFGVGLGGGIAAWVLVLGVPGAQTQPPVPTATLMPAAATVSPSASASPSLSPTPSLSPSATVSVKPQVVKHNVVVPQDVTTDPTTEAPTPTQSYAIDGLNGDGTQGPAAPVQMPAPAPSHTPAKPSPEPTTTGVLTQ